MPTKRFTQKQREDLLAMYMRDESLIDRLRVRRTGTCCQLDNNEARAIHKLFLDLQSIDDEIVQEWISAIWSHYVMSNSIRDIAESNDTHIAQIQQDIKCGLAFIKSRYPHFKFDKFAKKEASEKCAWRVYTGYAIFMLQSTKCKLIALSLLKKARQMVGFFVAWNKPE